MFVCGRCIYCAQHVLLSSARLSGRASSHTHSHKHTPPTNVGSKKAHSLSSYPTVPTEHLRNAYCTTSPLVYITEVTLLRKNMCFNNRYCMSVLKKKIYTCYILWAIRWIQTVVLDCYLPWGKIKYITTIAFSTNISLIFTVISKNTGQWVMASGWLYSLFIVEDNIAFRWWWCLAAWF